MRTRATIPYLAALVLLAWILGSLSRAATNGEGILSGSYWLLYIVYAIPLLALGGVVVMIVFLALSWKAVSDALGFGLAAKGRAKRRQSSTIQVLVWVAFWGLAVGVLFWRCGGLTCRTNSTETNQTLAATVSKAVGNSTGLSLPAFFEDLVGPVNVLGNLVTSPAFAVVFLGLLVVSTMILARGILVSFNETRAGRFLPVAVKEIQQVAVHEALAALKTEAEVDPRMRIMACYQKMIQAAARLGANVGVDRTARELEAGIRRTFELKGGAIRDLTLLFEEARYSLHTITERDSEKAESSLLEIGEELRMMTVPD